MQRTYEMRGGVAPAMSWSSYRLQLLEEWNGLLRLNPPESKVQSFLEQHPCLVPGSFGLGPSDNHGPFFDAVISQPMLPGLERPRPDFMWISSDSESVFPTLIEIESPSKKWFTKAGHPTHLFTQAINQLHTWKVWFDNPRNVLQFQELYDIGDTWWKWLAFEPRYVLVYGRRDEFESRPELRKRRRSLGLDTHALTFDRLKPHLDAKDSFCVCASRHKVISML